MAARNEDGVSEIIDRIYDVAVDPARYEELLDAWESRLSKQRRKAQRDGVPTPDADIAPHLRRAGLVLNQILRLGEAEKRGPLDTEVTAAFLVGPDMLIAESNRIAGDALNIAEGLPLTVLPLDPSDVERLQAAIRKSLRPSPEETTLLRFNLSAGDRSIVFHVAHHQANGRMLALVRATELGWPQHLSGAMREAFSLSTAEVEVVRSLAEGKSLREIAQARGRSLATVRTQISAILAKTETHSQAELVRITLGLMDVVDGAARASQPASQHLKAIAFRTLTLADGRRYDWIEFGAPDGRPCVFLPLDYGFIRWPARAEQAAERQDIRVVVPVRAGFGKSSPQPIVADYTAATADDLHHLIRHLGIDRCAIIALGADLRFAVALANKAPGLVSGILGCSADLPVVTMKQYERMHKWHRFVLINARYAPSILPFVLKAGFALVRRLGKEGWFRLVNADSPADIRTFTDPEIKEAILLGSEVSLSADHSAHAAVARECVDSEINWAHRIRACEVPIRLLQGSEDPQARPDTVRELAAEFPNLDIEIIEDCGQLLFFQLWPRVLDELEAFLPER